MYLNAFEVERRMRSEKKSISPLPCVSCEDSCEAGSFSESPMIISTVHHASAVGTISAFVSR